MSWLSESENRVIKVEYTDGHIVRRLPEGIADWADFSEIEIDGVTYIAIMSHTFVKISDYLYREV